MNKIEEINDKLHQLLPTTRYEINDYQEESFKWASSYQTDVQYLLKENKLLHEKLDVAISELKYIFDHEGWVRVRNVLEKLNEQ